MDECQFSQKTDLEIHEDLQILSGWTIYLCGCANGWSSYGTHCYKIYKELDVDHHEAEEKCLRENSFLVDIRDHDEQMFLKVLISTEVWDNNIWSGVRVGSRQLPLEGAYIWSSTDGSKFSSSLEWGPGQPDNYKLVEDCLSLLTHTDRQGLLVDMVCEFNPLLNGFIVDYNSFGYICKQHRGKPFETQKLCTCVLSFFIVLELARYKSLVSEFRIF